MSKLVKVYYRLLADISRLTGVRMDLPVDFDESWILVKGPQLDKQVLQYLEGNRDSYPELPEWLMPLWESFISNNKDYGSILRYLRTVLVFGYKAEYEPTYDQLQDAQKAFKSANMEVGGWCDYFDNSEYHRRPLFQEAKRLVSRVVSRGNLDELIPSHGPGAVFPSHRASDKSKFSICAPICAHYPYDSNFNCLPSLGLDDLLSSDKDSYDEIHAKLVAVPKDSRGPRLICVHPKEAIWIQQGQRRIIEQCITSHPLTRGKINFTDQGINGSLALSSSFSRGFTTIDLKEASDRVGRSLVRHLFGDYYYGKISCSRASHVRMLDGSLVELNMWAPMGNCLTFPVESLVFWALVRAGIRCRHGQHCDDVYVFGDDIIVPTDLYDGAIYGLCSAGLIPNEAKTFRKGFFRESCGVDAYLGKDVTPYRMRVRTVTSYSDAESASDLAKRLYQAGFRETPAYLYRLIRQRCGPLAITNDPHCQGLVEYTDYDFGKILRYCNRMRYNSSLQRWEVPCRKLIRTTEVLKHHAWWHVQDSLLRLIRKDHGFSSFSFEHHNSMPGEYISDRGTEYPSPRGERLQTIWSPINMG